MAEEQQKAKKEDHPFEFNMIMTESSLMQSRMRERETVTQQLNFLASNTTTKLLYTRHWILDSGASSHFIKDVSRFVTYEWLESPIPIQTGNGTMFATVRGDVELCIIIGKVIIKEVLLVPELAVDAGMLSIPALIKSGFTINFSGDTATIHKESKLYAMAKSSGGLYLVVEYERVEDYAMAIQCFDRQPFLVWYCRLGHING